jgi:hypothetical protein
MMTEGMSFGALQCSTFSVGLAPDISRPSQTQRKAKPENCETSQYFQIIVCFGSQQIIYEVMCSRLFRGIHDMAGVRGGDL